MKAAQALDGVQLFVIPDRKTPQALYEKCARIRRAGVNVHCPSLEEQETYLSKLGIPRLVAYDSDHRRNVGFLMALESDAEYLISIDDDNLCIDGKEFLQQHGVVCDEENDFDSLESSNGWFNLCGLMQVDPPNVYPRGFPYRFRGKEALYSQKKERVKVHLNAGLWLQDPDLDAVTWLANPAKAVSFRGPSIVLAQNTWSPVNTQNTAVHRDAVVAFYFIRMDHRVIGMRMDRWGDIFSGYFCQACLRHLGYRVRVGTPVVNHVRNHHDYLLDLKSELPCILMVEELVECLREMRLQGSSYQETYLCLADELEVTTNKLNGVFRDQSARQFIRDTTSDMRGWIKAVQTLLG